VLLHQGYFLHRSSAFQSVGHAIVQQRSRRRTLTAKYQMTETTDMIRQYLAALGDSASGRELLALHAPQAIVPDGNRLRACGAVAPDQFAIEHRARCEAGAGVLPDFGNPVALEMPVPAADRESGTTAWFEVTEARTGRSMHLALGVVSIDDTPRIDWCTVTTRAEPWPYRQGLLRSLADYAWLLKAEPVPSRLLLDASYFRLCWRAPLPLRTLPGARFSCRMSTVCCRNEFEIALAPEAQHVIDAVPWDAVEPRLAGTHLPVRPDGRLQLKQANVPCRFLGADRQCLMHRAVGLQPFDTCAIYPYTFARTPDGVDVALSPVCPSARAGIGMEVAACEDDLRDRLAQAQPRVAGALCLSPGRSISWPDFRGIEQGLLSCIGAGELPLRRRLYVGCRTLGAIGRDQPFDTAAWLSEPLPDILPELRTALRGMLQKILGWDRPVLRSLPPAIPEDLSRLEARDGSMVVRILENMLFSKSYSFQYDLTTAFNFAIVLYLLVLVMQAATPGPLPDNHWQELGALGVHGLLKDVLHDGVPEGFRSALGTPEFGLWLLAV
jgi:hypothetical protein